jgi:hypothetical protein
MVVIRVCCSPVHEVRCGVQGTNMILQLVQDPRNLEYFLEHDTMLTALTRILNEDHKKSVDLVPPTSPILCLCCM